jgi:methyltransferase (TIGR00027 family)
MRQNQSSLTAMGIALLRAVETEKPAGEGICHDPLARKFVPSWFYYLMKLFISSGYAEMRGRGIMGFILARCRFIDDLLSDELNRGLQQLVILGAGFDSRAYRFDLLSRGVKVFEVDHPATQHDQVKKLEQILAPVGLPKNVTFVPVDFSRQSLEAGLAECGYKERERTLFIWEGVSEYLDLPAVDSTLAFVAHHSAPGSVIVFDYMYRELLEGKIKGHGEVSSMRRYRGFSNEVLSFGIEQGQIEPFLAQRGFSRSSNITGPDLQKRYFTAKNAGRKVASGYAIAVGIV